MAQAFENQLDRYGVGVCSPMEYLVKPSRFSAEELELFAIPCDHPDSLKVQNWLQLSGGIDGRPWGIHADHLNPVERMMGPLEALL